MIGADTFTGPALGPQWEWNHNPDTSQVLRRQRAAAADRDRDQRPLLARNTLTHRIQGPTSTATIELDYSAMADGDRAGLAMLRDSSAWIGVKRDNGATRVVMTNGLTMNSSWNTTGTGTEAASANVSGGRIWLRANADIRPGSGRQARFSYSTDGVNFTTLGPAFTLNNAWQFFMGYRFGDLQLRHPGARRRGDRQPVRPDHALTGATAPATCARPSSTVVWTRSRGGRCACDCPGERGQPALASHRRRRHRPCTTASR